MPTLSVGLTLKLRIFSRCSSLVVEHMFDDLTKVFTRLLLLQKSNYK